MTYKNKNLKKVWYVSLFFNQMFYTNPTVQFPCKLYVLVLSLQEVQALRLFSKHVMSQVT